MIKESSSCSVQLNGASDYSELTLDCKKKNADMDLKNVYELVFNLEMILTAVDLTKKYIDLNEEKGVKKDVKTNDNDVIIDYKWIIRNMRDFFSQTFENNIDIILGKEVTVLININVIAKYE